MIRTFLDLSTAHASPEARRWLEMQATENGKQSADGLDTHAVAAFRHGWMMHVPNSEMWGWEAPTVPLDLRDVCVEAALSGCDYILFDADAEEIGTLPTWQEPDAPTDEGLTDEEKAAFAAVNRDHFQEIGFPPEDGGLADELETDSPMPADPGDGVAHGRSSDLMPHVIPADAAVHYSKSGREKLDRLGHIPVDKAVLAELKEAAAELHALMQEALTTHIYDEDNGDEIPDDCAYTASIARVEKALAAI